MKLATKVLESFKRIKPKSIKESTDNWYGIEIDDDGKGGKAIVGPVASKSIAMKDMRKFYVWDTEKEYKEIGIVFMNNPDVKFI